jgi:hypothetical protein
LRQGTKFSASPLCRIGTSRSMRFARP